MPTQLGDHLDKAGREIEKTIGCCARFSFISRNYTNHLNAIVDVAGDDAHVTYHRVCALKTYFLFFYGRGIFIDKSTTYVDFVNI